MKKLQEIELKIKDESEDGVFAISLVENPAIEEDFVYLSKDEIQLKVVNEDKRIVVGFALVPEKRIYRAMQGKEFNIYFSKDTVRRSAELFMKKMNTQNFTLEHDKKVEGISVIESWIVEDAKQDKSNLYNLGAKGGEWVVMSKVYNDAVWEEVKNGTYRAYSIEAMYDGFEQLQSKNVNINKVEMEKQILDELATLLAAEKVKLSIIDDFSNAEEMIYEFYGRGANKALDALAPLKAALAEFEKATNYIDKVYKMGMSAESQAKSLGVELPAKYNNSKTRLVKTEAQIKQANSLVNKIISDIKF